MLSSPVYVCAFMYVCVCIFEFLWTTPMDLESFKLPWFVLPNASHLTLFPSDLTSWLLSFPVSLLWNLTLGRVVWAKEDPETQCYEQWRLALTSLFILFQWLCVSHLFSLQVKTKMFYLSAQCTQPGTWKSSCVLSASYIITIHNDCGNRAQLEVLLMMYKPRYGICCCPSSFQWAWEIQNPCYVEQMLW